MSPFALIILGIVIWLFFSPIIGILLVIAGLIWLATMAPSWRGGYTGRRRYWY